MFHQIAYTPILGLPLVMWGGLITFALLCTTGTLGYLVFTGKMPTGFKWHKRCAMATFAMGFLHGLLALLSYFGQ
ncbi:hypothetical protein HZA44_01165 [Candidatus Peregrinibacteria bacterium]|nr:hypothetical protein [Candidatus Peregrinibacteria bacterium]